MSTEAEQAAAKEAEAAAAAEATEAAEAEAAKAKEAEGNTEDLTDEEKAEAAKAEEVETGEFDTDVWGTTGDEAGDSVLQLLHESGVEVDTAKALLFDAVQAGKPEDIDRDALVEKVGKVKATLIMAGIENFVGKRSEATAKAVAAVHEAAGGKEAWETMLPWVSKAIPEEELSEYRDMIDAGGVKAKLAVGELVKRYNADPKNERLSKKEVVGDNTVKAVEPGLTQRQYGDQLVALNRAGKATPEARAKLLAARNRGKKQGI